MKCHYPENIDKLFLNVTNQYRMCFMEVIVIIMNQCQLNHGQIVQMGGIKIFYAIVVDKLNG